VRNLTKTITSGKVQNKGVEQDLPFDVPADVFPFRHHFADPSHRTVILEEAGHFIQEDAPEQIASAIQSWWQAHPQWVIQPIGREGSQAQPRVVP